MKNTCRISFILFTLIFQSALFAKVINLSSGTQQTNLIELFTSEGCSSCPPAEHWLNSLKDDKRLWKQIIPLAFHVDYWDYIGWKDKFAKPENTRRQYTYQREKGIGTVYTPGFINNGKEWRRWFGLRNIAISDKMPGQLDVTVDGNQIKAKFTPKNSTLKEWKLNVALLGFGFETSIKAGENEGRKLQHDFVVIGQKMQNSSNATWKMELPTTTLHDTVKKRGIAVWVSQIDRQQPIQAVGGWLD